MTRSFDEAWFVDGEGIREYTMHDLSIYISRPQRPPPQKHINERPKTQNWGYSKYIRDQRIYFSIVRNNYGIVAVPQDERR